MGAKRLVIFDFDGTLVDTGGDIKKYKTIYREKTGLDWQGSWWDNPKSLDYDMFKFIIKIYSSRIFEIFYVRI